MGATAADNINSYPNSYPLSQSAKLRNAITQAGIRTHLQAIENIANASPNLNVAPGNPGFVTARDYVVNTLKAAGYSPVVTAFQFPYYRVNALPVFQEVDSGGNLVHQYQYVTDFLLATYSASADVTRQVQPVDVVVPIGSNLPNTSTSGCEASDFAGFTAGNIALIQRGTCSFLQKATNAQNAGASGVILFNEGQANRTGVIDATLGQPGFHIPVIGVNYATGADLVTRSRSGPVYVHIQDDTASDFRTSWNVSADTKSGSAQHLVLLTSTLGGDFAQGFVGTAPNIGKGYIDTSQEGSVAADLLIAQQISKLGIKPENKVRFVFWGQGTYGPQTFVQNASPSDLASIRADLSLDYIGATNYVRFVFNGSGSVYPDPNGLPPASAAIENVFNNYFGALGLPTSPYAAANSGDRYNFTANQTGVPVGGLYSGGFDIKTPAQQAIYGGTANQYDNPCEAVALTDTLCDTLSNNVDLGFLQQEAQAAAHAVLAFSNQNN
jgi:Zn-dependent M28 family amino/carboxypeptidase